MANVLIQKQDASVKRQTSILAWGALLHLTVPRYVEIAALG
jgi:hypothetical protein